MTIREELLETARDLEHSADAFMHVEIANQLRTPASRMTVEGDIGKLLDELNAAAISLGLRWDDLTATETANRENIGKVCTRAATALQSLSERVKTLEETNVAFSIGMEKNLSIARDFADRAEKAEARVKELEAVVEAAEAWKAEYEGEDRPSVACAARLNLWAKLAALTPKEQSNG